MKHARRSVSDSDVRRYEMFAQTLQQSQTIAASNLSFSDSNVTQNNPGVTSGSLLNPSHGDDDDLYA